MASMQKTRRFPSGLASDFCVIGAFLTRKLEKTREYFVIDMTFGSERNTLSPRELRGAHEPLYDFIVLS